MRILVTGGLGVNGSAVTHNLAERGHDVIVLEPHGDTALLGDAAADVELVEGDVRDLDGIVATLRDRRVDRIVHMAAIVQGFQTEQHAAFEVNAMGSVNVLEAARRCDVGRVVFTSTRAVYGSAVGEHAHPTYKPYVEDDPIVGRLVYDTCKIAVEGMGRNYSDAFGLDFVALRFAHIVGPGKSARYAGHSVCSRMIDDSIAGRPVVIERGGDQRDDVIYVADAAEGAVLATLSDRPGFRIYNISRGVATTLGDLAEAIHRILPEADITIGPGLDYMQSGHLWYGPMSNTRAREELGFEPRYDLDALVADYVARVREMAGAA